MAGSYTTGEPDAYITLNEDTSPVSPSAGKQILQGEVGGIRATGNLNVPEGYAILTGGRQESRPANYKQLKWWYAALAARDYRQARVLFHGDSVVNGAYATTKERSFTRLYADALQRMYRVGGVGYVGTEAHNSGWVKVGGTSLTSNGIALQTYQMTGTAQTATYTFTGDRFELYFTGGTGVGNAEIVIDGGSTITHNTFLAALGKVKYDSGALNPTASGTHTVLVRGAAAATVLLDGIVCYNTDYGKGVMIFEAGHNGYHASHFTPTNLDHWIAMGPRFINPDLVFIEFGLNEAELNVAPATFKANLGTLVDNYRTFCEHDVSIVILGMWGRGDGTNTDSEWQTYRTAMRQVANEKNVAFFDMYDLGGWMGTTGEMNVDDLVTNGTTTITSNKVFFRSVDTGSSISGTNIPGGATFTYVSQTQATLSSAATGSGTNAAVMVRKDPQLLTFDLLHPWDRGSQWLADELARMTAGLPKLSAIPAGIFDNKGEIIAGGNADLAVKVEAPQEGQVLSGALGAASGLIWADIGHTGRFGLVQANPGANTITTVGITAPTLIGTGTAASGDQPSGAYVTYTTSNLANNDAGLNTASNIGRSAWIPEFSTTILTGGLLSTTRLCAGVYSASPLTAADVGSLHGAGFRYDTSVDGTAFWRTYTKDGTTALVATTTIAITVAARYHLRVEFRGTVGTNATEVRFYINNVLASIHRANLPGGSTNNLGFSVGVRCLAAAAARSVLINRIGFTTT